MEPNTARAEAERWLGISAKLLAARDLVGSRSFAIRAREADPTNPISDQILAVVDTLIAAEKRVINSSHHDWYSILQLSHLVRDPDLIASQYRRLVLLLNPDQNHLPFADFAFRVVVDAWSVLSDPTKKWIYDSELSIFLQRSSAPPDPEPVRVDSAASATYQFFQQPAPPQTQAQQQQQQWIHHLQEQQQQQQQQQQQTPPPQLQERQLFHQQHHPQPQAPPPPQPQHQWLPQTQPQQLQQLLPEQQQRPSQPLWLPQAQQPPPQPQQPPQPPPQPQQPPQPPPQPQQPPPPQWPPPQLKEPQNPPQLQRPQPQQQQQKQPQQPQQQKQQQPPPPPQQQQQKQPPQQKQKQPQQSQQQQQKQPQQQRTPTPPPPPPAPVQTRPTPWPPQEAPQQLQKENNNGRQEEGIRRESSVPSERVTDNGHKRSDFNDSANNNDNHDYDGGGGQIEGFWTACPYCYYLYEYPKTFEDCTLRCQNCRRAFHARQIPNPPGTEGRGGEASFCSWGFFPMGFSMTSWKKNMPSGGEAIGSNWVPFSPMFACPVQGVKKKAWRTVDEGDEDFHVLDSSDDSDSSDDWGNTKKRKTQGNVKGSRGRPRKGNTEREKMGNQHSVGAAGGAGGDNLRRAAEMQRNANHGIKNDVINKAAAGSLKKQTVKGVRGRKKLDLNVEFSNEVEDHASATRDGTGEEVVGFFEGLDEFLSTLPILKS